MSTNPIKQDPKTGKWTFVVDLGVDPATGKRRQVRRKGFERKRDAEQARSDLLSEAGKGIVPPKQTGKVKITFAALADEWMLTKRTQVNPKPIRPVTLRTYEVEIRHAVRSFGGLPVSQVNETHVAEVVHAMVMKGLTRRTVRMMLLTVRGTLDLAVDRGHVQRNVAAKIKAGGKDSVRRASLTTAELPKITAYLKDQPLAPLWALTTYGLRRSEVMGLQWQDLDLTAGTITVARSVTASGRAGSGRNIAADPKTQQGWRTLPLPPDLLADFRGLREQQAQAHGFASVQGEAWVAVDNHGDPLRPEHWSKWWKAACVAAGVTVVPLHGARHTSVMVMRSKGIPDRIVAAWHGHDEATMRKFYDTVGQDDLSLAGALIASIAGGT